MQVRLLKCLVDNIVVDISFNQIGGLCTLAFLESMDRRVDREHLFKKSIILVRDQGTAKRRRRLTDRATQLLQLRSAQGLSKTDAQRSTHPGCWARALLTDWVRSRCQLWSLTFSTVGDCHGYFAQVKAWCYYESRLLGAHHGLISTYALETLVLYIFNLYHRELNSPLEVGVTQGWETGSGDSGSGVVRHLTWR